jgi:transmembrane sensor
VSETNHETKFIYGTPAINARAADWVIARRESGEWSEARQAELDAWLASSPANAIAYFRIDSTWSRADRLNALRPPKMPREQSPILRRIVAAFAGTGLVAFVVVQSLHLTDDKKVYSTAVGGQMTISLGDGSQVELNTDTRIRIADGAGERKLWLDKGEAYFNVRHDPTNPLVLWVDGQRIVDVGTKFIARLDGEQTRIVVQEGSVLFEPQASNKQLSLVPGDVLVATAKTVSVSKKSTHDLATELGWRNGVVTFKRTPLAQAAAELNRYAARKIIVADVTARNMTISGTFPVHNVALFSRLVNVGLGLHVQDGTEDIVITSK